MIRDIKTPDDPKFATKKVPQTWVADAGSISALVFSFSFRLPSLSSAKGFNVFSINWHSCHFSHAESCEDNTIIISMIGDKKSK